MQDQAEEDDRDNEPDALQTKYNERGGGGDEILELCAGLAAEKIPKTNESGVLGTYEQEAACHVVDAVCQRYHEGGNNQCQIEQDHRRVGRKVLDRLLDGIDQRCDRNQVSDHVEDLEPASGIGWVGRRSRIGETTQNSARAPHHGPMEHELEARAQLGTECSQERHSWQLADRAHGPHFAGVLVRS